MAKYVLGIDFGEDTCVIAAIKRGGKSPVEIILNDSKKRAIASMVAFGENKRILGDAAKRQQMSNMENTISGFKRFIGMHFRYPGVQREIQKLPVKNFEYPNGRIGIELRFLNEERTRPFTPTQITAMLLTHLKQTAEKQLGSEVLDVVIGVPCNFTDIQNTAVKNAGEIAGFHNVKVLKETTAVAITYGDDNCHLLQSNKGPVNVVFMDVGHTSLQVSVVKFLKKKQETLATSVDLRLGGQDITLKLAAYFQNYFRKSFNVDATSNHTAMMRLLTEAEILKKKMSENVSDIHITIRHPDGNKDVSGKMQQAQMEPIIKQSLNYMRGTLNECLENSKLKRQDISTVIAVGGSSRIPAVQRIIQEVFGQNPTSFMNSDEVVARGCALYCASFNNGFPKHGYQIQEVPTSSVAFNEGFARPLHNSLEPKALSMDELQSMKEEEIQMVKADSDEKRRLEAKNALETYLIKLKKSLTEARNLDSYGKEVKKSLNKAEELLFNQENYCQGDEYNKILVEFKKHGEQIEKTSRSKRKCRDDAKVPMVRMAGENQIREQHARMAREKQVEEEERHKRELEFKEQQRKEQEEKEQLQKKLEEAEAALEAQKNMPWWKRVIPRF